MGQLLVPNFETLEGGGGCQKKMDDLGNLKSSLYLPGVLTMLLVKKDFVE